MPEDEGDRRRIEPDVERIEHRARHRHAEMRLEQRRHVRRHDGHHVAAPDAPCRQRRSEPPAAGIGLGPVAPDLAVHDRDPLRPHGGGARDEAQRRQRGKIRRVARQIEWAHRILRRQSARAFVARPAANSGQIRTGTRRQSSAGADSSPSGAAPQDCRKAAMASKPAGGRVGSPGSPRGIQMIVS